MDTLSDDCLTLIFKHLDLRSRLASAKTCKQWRRLVNDPSTLMDDVSEVYFDKWNPGDENSEVSSVSAVFSHFKKCRQLKLGPGVAHGFLLEQRLKDQMDRFENVVLTPKEWGYEDSLAPCMPLLPAFVKRLRVDDCWPERFSLNLPNSVQLESLELTFLDVVDEEANMFDLPLTLTRYDYSYSCPFYDSPASCYPVYTFVHGRVTDYFLRTLRVGPLLSELNLDGPYFTDKSFSAFLSTIHDGSPNLHRILFQEMLFEFDDPNALFKEFSIDDRRLLPFKWIKFGRCLGQWANAAELLLFVCNVEVLVIDFWDKFPEAELSDIYKLTPMIKKKGAKLELTIYSVDEPRNLEDVLVPTELSGILTKMELIKVHHTQLLQAILNDDDSFNLLTEIRLEECIGLGDATLKVVAKWCKNLKKLKFQPHRCLGLLNILTDQCLLPFLSHWNDRNSAQLSIEYLKPARPFGGFNLPIDQEKGDFQDGKKWMLFRKACLLDGCDGMGSRLVIWDQFQKSIIITDYKRNFDHHVKISVEKGKCVVEEKRGTEFVVDKTDHIEDE